LCDDAIICHDEGVHSFILVICLTLTLPVLCVLVAFVAF